MNNIKSNKNATNSAPAIFFNRFVFICFILSHGFVLFVYYHMWTILPNQEAKRPKDLFAKAQDFPYNKNIK